MISKIFGSIKHRGQRGPVLLYIWSPLFDIPFLKFGLSRSKTLYIVQPVSKSNRMLITSNNDVLNLRCWTGIVMGKKIDVNNFNFPSRQVW